MTTAIGIDVLLNRRLDLVQGKRVGLVASTASVDASAYTSVERLFGRVNLTALFGPEHGLRGAAQAGDHVGTDIDPLTGLPVYSLYGDTQKPTPDMLRDLDILLFDLPDGGVRFFTYLSTLAYVLEAAAEVGLPVLVLDRPNPITGLRVEGMMLEEGYRSFVGVYPIPIRHGMTAGEIARLFNETFNIGCDLTVVPMEGWTRPLWFDQTGLSFVPPSPNMPTLQALTLYPGTCLMEGTNLSEGRGTTMPFQYLGAPWLDAEKVARAMDDLPGVRFRPVYFTPTFSKYAGELCAGVHPVVLDRDVFQPIEATLHLITRIKAIHPDKFAWRPPWSEGGHRPIDLLTGGKRVREHLDADRPVEDLIQGWQEGLTAFRTLREGFLMY